MKTRVEILKKNYGFNKASYKYIPAGGEIFKYIGQLVIYIDRKRKESGEWEADVKKAIIESIDDYDPMTMTYNCHYKVAGDDEVKELRIIPEGYSFGNPEETGVMQNFLPYSTHCHLVEDELFYGRLKELYDTKDTMSIEDLSTISKSKDKESILKYSHNIGCIIKLDECPDEVLYFRIHSLSLRHKVGSSYVLSYSDGETSHKIQINSSDKEYDFEGLGKFKIIDLAQ